MEERHDFYFVGFSSACRQQLTKYFNDFETSTEYGRLFNRRIIIVNAPGHRHPPALLAIAHDTKRISEHHIRYARRGLATGKNDLVGIKFYTDVTEVKGNVFVKAYLRMEVGLDDVKVKGKEFVKYKRDSSSTTDQLLKRVILPGTEEYKDVTLPITGEDGAYLSAGQWDFSHDLMLKLVRMCELYNNEAWPHLGGDGPWTTEEKKEFNHLLSIVPDEIRKEHPWLIEFRVLDEPLPIV